MIRTSDREQAASAAAEVRAFAEAALMVAASTLVGLAIAPRWGNSRRRPALPAGGARRGDPRRTVARRCSRRSLRRSPIISSSPRPTTRSASRTRPTSSRSSSCSSSRSSPASSPPRCGSRRESRRRMRRATRPSPGSPGGCCPAPPSRRSPTSSSAQLGSAVRMQRRAACRACPSRKLIAAAPPSSLTPSDIAAAALTLETGQPAGRGVDRVDPAQWQFHPVRSGTVIWRRWAWRATTACRRSVRRSSRCCRICSTRWRCALERARLEGEARDFAAVRERDRLRARPCSRRSAGMSGRRSQRSQMP